MQESTAKVRSLPLVASLVGSTPGALASDQAPVRIAGPTYQNVQSLLTGSGAPDALLLYPQDAAQAHDWLRALRADGRFSLTPIFTLRDFGNAVTTLTDGVVEGPSDLFARLAELRDRLTSVPSQGDLGADARLLAFLYTRPDHTIDPVCEWNSETIYRYPLLEAFAERGDSAAKWLTTLRRRGLVEAVELVDRMHLCSSCHGAHLNYVDVCPQCSSIDIAESIFLHCHTCGHVATQDEYVSASGLGCPKCLARLRHIGVDYDRALEAYSCSSCSGRFTEADVRARCLHCHTMCKTDSLEELRVERYRLSQAGQLTARTGQMNELFALIDEFSCAHPTYFAQTLEFLLGLGRRHTEIEFGVACVRFVNLRELMVQLPRVKLTQLVDGFGTRLRELVRTTDLVLREDDEHCWLLLPQTPQSGVQTLMSRVRKIASEPGNETDGRLHLKIASITSRQLGDRTLDAKLLMAELRSQAD
jgi:hypothetical protein